MESEELPLVLNDILQVPVHTLSKQLKHQQKSQEQGSNIALKAIRDLLQRVSAKESTGESVDTEKIVAALDKISSKLTEVRDQAKASSAELQSSLESLTFRVAMRNGSLPGPSQDSHDPKRARPSTDPSHATSGRMLDLAVICNHLLRTCRFETFKTLCKESGCEFLLPDAEVFLNHTSIHHALEAKHDAESALLWCSENRAALKRIHSSFEFDLRLRQFCEIVERGELNEAVSFARKHLAQNANDDRMRRAMAMLAFPKGSLRETPYRQFISEDRWEGLAEKFTRERDAVLNLNRISPLEILVRVGLAVTQTHSCRPDGPGKYAGCPACQPSLGKLALTIPRTIRERSSLVCRISGALMEDPLVLPNGQAYSRIALEQMAASRGDGRVCCPVTHQEFSLKDCKRAFVL